MKKLSYLLLTFAAAAFIIVGCEGPDGPAGPKGDTGLQGEQGIQGDTGPSGTTTCTNCHDDSAEIATVQGQFNNSLHAMGENSQYASDANAYGPCTQCHTNQGFHEYWGGDQTTASAYDDAQQPNCYTCHDIHETHTEADWALSYSSSTTLNHGGATWDKGNSNLCARCHQALPVSPMPVVAGAEVILTSDRWGTHHGPVANILTGASGSGLYEIAGTVTYSNSMHSSMLTSCVACHMADAYGSFAGGHTMKMEYERHETPTLNDKGCTTCHSYAGPFGSVNGYLLSDLVAFQAPIVVKLNTLKGHLETLGIYDPANGRNVKGTFSADIAGAYLNWQAITEDRSNGVHNPKYINAILDNSIAAMAALVAPM